MSNYIGVKCPVCSKKFTQTDDIVVCPVCGAPHHRECYARENACAFAADHLAGKEWRPPAPDPEHHGEDEPYSWGKSHDYDGESVVCGTCRSKNAKSAIFCQTCGSRINFESEGFRAGSFADMNPVYTVYGGLNPDEKIEDETARDLAIYIGSNSAYYLPRFKMMAETSRSITFNFAAMFFSFFYFFYRKMYLIGSVLLGLFVIGSVPSILWMLENPQQLTDMLPPFMHQYFDALPSVPVDREKNAYYQQLSNVIGMIDFTVRIALSFCANRFYCTQVMNGVKQVRESMPKPHDEAAYCERLRMQGGTSKAAVIVLISAYFAASFIIAMFLSYNLLQMGG